MERPPDSWLVRLPETFHPIVIVPLRVESFHDDGVPASKWRGYDEAGELCYYRHQYSQWEELFDDEEPGERLIVSEALEAWRLLDGRWLRNVQRVDGPVRCLGGGFDSGFEVVGAQAIPRL